MLEEAMNNIEEDNKPLDPIVRLQLLIQLGETCPVCGHVFESIEDLIARDVQQVEDESFCQACLTTGEAL